MYDFEFEKPSTVAEAVAALASENATALGGGQTLIPTMKQRLASPSKLVSLAGIAEMQGISASGGSISIGGGCSHAAVADGAGAYPALAALAGGIGDAAVRNRGTIGGSLANNDPSADYPCAALASGATINTNARAISADDYFQGMFETALDEGEIITSVEFPIPDAANYQKFEQPASRFALVGVMVAKYSGGVRVAVTGASESGVFRWAEAETALSAIIGHARLEAPVDQQPERTDLLRPQHLFRPLEVGLAGRPGRHDKVALPHDPQDFANPVAKPPGAVADGVDHGAVHKPPERFSRRRVAAYPMQFVCRHRIPTPFQIKKTLGICATSEPQIIRPPPQYL